MIKRTIRLLLSLIATLACVASLPLAANPSAPVDNAPISPDEPRRIEQFLLLQDHELDQLIAILQRIRDMPEAQRKELAATVDQFRRMSGEQRRSLRDGQRRDTQSPHPQHQQHDNEAWRQMMNSLSPEQRLDIQLRIDSAPRYQRRALRDAILKEWQSQQ